MKILVTGGSGFLGSHLCDRLIELNHEVICLDNFYTGSKQNILHHLDNPQFELVEHDVVDQINDIKVDQIYNFACPASPVHYQKDPIKTVQTSVLGAINVLNIANRFDAKILQASTSEVYGDPQVHPQTEDYRGSVNPIGPRACYDEGKRCAETLFFDYNGKYDIDTRVVRIFNTYGPRMMADDGRVVSNFITQALKGEDITVYGDGKQTRSFCYVDDLIAAIIKMMEQKSFIGPVNIGNPNEFTVLELAQEIIKLTNSNGEIVFRKLPIDDPMQRCPDISLAKNKLEWEPKIQLEEGLQRTIEYFSQIV